MNILAVDTALGACSAALLEDDRVISRRWAAMERGHAEALAPMVNEVMREANLAFQALDRLAVTVGPGTFTGQRVGLAFMRGLRVALSRPLLGVTSLAAMAEQARTEASASCAAAIHDARRGEVYVEVLGAHFSARLLTFEDACSALSDLRGKLILAGTAAARMGETLRHKSRASSRRTPSGSLAWLWAWSLENCPLAHFIYVHPTRSCRRRGHEDGSAYASSRRGYFGPSACDIFRRRLEC